MTKLFISYRRADSQYVTDSIHDYMVDHFGEDNVFLDVGSIPFGVDFREYLAEQIAAHDVVLVVIGPDWARIMAERASQANDFVRIEIENALEQGKLVIPVLVKEAHMPSFDNLPASIEDLQWRNSAVVRRKPDLENDCARLAAGIRSYFNIPSSAPAQPTTRTQHIASEKLLPQPFAWIDIPAGWVTLENNLDGNQTYVGSKGQSKTFDVPAFAIAKYPITNAQFAKFIEAGGYSNQTWWTEVGWAQRLKEGWAKPRYLGDSRSRRNPLKYGFRPYLLGSGSSQWDGAEQPVVGVSWYEAVAFCLWLSEASSESIMLPTEQQWQRAAQGDKGYTYPWGNEWDCKRCNNSVDTKRVDITTTPVTHYEGKGDSPYGVVDISGNVWEWCVTEYESGNQGIDGRNRRVLRGGSLFSSDTENFRAAYRNWNSPYDWVTDWGFRVSRNP